MLQKWFNNLSKKQLSLVRIISYCISIWLILYSCWLYNSVSFVARIEQRYGGAGALPCQVNASFFAISGIIIITVLIYLEFGRSKK